VRIRSIPRLFVIALSFTVVLTSLIASPAAAGRIEWSETESQEDAFVQACDKFDITSSYTVTTAHLLVTDSSGDEVHEQMQVDFAGAIGIAVTGKSYAYDGRFTRRSDYNRGNVTVTDLLLRFEVGTPGQFSVAIARIERNLMADPPAIVKMLVPNTLRMSDLCYLFGGSEGRVAPVGLPWLQHAYSPPGVLEQCDLMTQNPGQPRYPNQWLLDESCPSAGITL
jgi:hypothetical protein